MRVRVLLQLFCAAFAGACALAAAQDSAAASRATESRPAGRPAVAGTLIVLNKGEDTASLVDLASGRAVATLKTGPNPNEVAISPDGATAVISDMGHGRKMRGHTLTVCDLRSQSIRSTIELGAHGTPHGVLWLDASRVLITSHDTDSLVTVSIADGKVESAIATGQKGTHLVVLTPDRKRAFAANAFSGTVSAIDLVERKVVATLTCGARAEGISISPDGRMVAVGNVGADSVTFIDAQKLEVTRTVEGVTAPIRTAFSPGGRHVMVSCGDGTIRMLDAADGSVARRIELAGQRIAIPTGAHPHPLPMNFALAPNGSLMLVVLVTSDAVAAIDLDRFEVVRLYDTGELPDGIATSSIVLNTNSDK